MGKTKKKEEVEENTQEEMVVLAPKEIDGEIVKTDTNIRTDVDVKNPQVEDLPPGVCLTC